jgi:hypothetical protein
MGQRKATEALGGARGSLGASPVSARPSWSKRDHHAGRGVESWAGADDGFVEVAEAADREVSFGRYRDYVARLTLGCDLLNRRLAVIVDAVGEGRATVGRLRNRVRPASAKAAVMPIMVRFMSCPLHSTHPSAARQRLGPKADCACAEAVRTCFRADHEPAKRLVVFTASGHLTAAEVLDVQDQLRADPNFDPVFSLLADHLQITGSDFDGLELLDMARNALFGPTARRAFVIRGKLGYGLVPMFGTFASLETRSGDVRVFEEDRKIWARPCSG